MDTYSITTNLPPSPSYTVERRPEFVYRHKYKIAAATAAAFFAIGYIYCYSTNLPDTSSFYKLMRPIFIYNIEYHSCPNLYETTTSPYLLTSKIYSLITILSVGFSGYIWFSKKNEINKLKQEKLDLSHQLQESNTKLHNTGLDFQQFLELASINFLELLINQLTNEDEDIYNSGIINIIGGLNHEQLLYRKDDGKCILALILLKFNKNVSTVSEFLDKIHLNKRVQVDDSRITQVIRLFEEPNNDQQIIKKINNLNLSFDEIINMTENRQSILEEALKRYDKNSSDYQILYTIIDKIPYVNNTSTPEFSLSCKRSSEGVTDE